ncbi:hypothetical protein [Mycolicibacter hiberniae]|uniref:Uncharacterized protein n=2 Tax=Mycolicibacter hiberniae TaxID=29314 RepID=A0A7I7WZV6_9MYCO|nr:hypothetical protein [Mycolicibacter hiberniae]MCV7086566.1 hypothetical protein [Mycolicibacter hiberniae]BBZ22147.1 hypothetical protein MHIB_05650 [Mycolicibacter hiberniae]
MSDAAESAHVSLLMADYANVDPQGKLNIVGGGITGLGCEVASGAVTAPHAVVAVVSFGAEFVGESPAVELSLEDENGALVELPGSAGVPEFLRVGHVGQLEPLRLQGLYIPKDAVRPSVQFVMHFATGLPLPPGHRYVWRVRVDHETKAEWTYVFYVPEPASPPVLG